MAGLKLSNVRKTFGETVVLDGIDLDIADGEFVVFVGPSGCGKSTLLRVIAGLEDISRGEIRIGGETMNGVAPSRRGVAMVFQSYALYPHMTVRENMAFGLRLAKADKAEIERAVEAAARLLRIDHLMDRRPKALSGGQRQRVAIGRAIVRKPKVFLFDEPLSNLDAALRVSMRYEFAKLHEDLGTTMIYVTHDQVEAMTLADRIVVLSDGRVEQTGTPMGLYHRPDTLFVAGFIGSPRMNFMEGRIVEAALHHVMIRLTSGDVLKADVHAETAKPGDTVTFGVRPEHFDPRLATNRLTVAVRFVERLGHVTFAYGRLERQDVEMTIQLPPDLDVAPGTALRVGVDPSAGHVFDAGGRAFQRPHGPPASVADESVTERRRS